MLTLDDYKESLEKIKNDNIDLGKIIFQAKHENIIISGVITSRKRVRFTVGVD